MPRSIEVARLFARMDLDVKNAERETGKIGSALSGLADTIVKHPVAALGTLGAAAGAAALKLADMAGEFEQQMTRVNTVAQVSKDELGRLADGVLELFASLPVDSTQELTDGLYDIISAGIPASEAIDVLRVAAEAAVGGTTDVATSVKGLTVALNVFKDDGLTAADAADTLFVGVNKGITTFDKLSDSIGVVAPLAKNLGVSFQELTAAEATLTTKGFETSAAATSLRAIFSNLLKPTSELRREYPELAEAFSATALQSKGLGGFLNELAPVVLDNRDAAVKMFGSVEALNAVLALTGDGGQKFNEVLGAMETRAGAATAAYNEMAGTTENLRKVLRNQLNAELLELGDRILPLVNQGLQLTLNLLNQLTGTPSTSFVNKLTQEVKLLTDAFDVLPVATTEKDIERLQRATENLTHAGLGNMRETLEGLSTKELKIASKGLGTLLELTDENNRSTEAWTDAWIAAQEILTTRTDALEEDAELVETHTDHLGDNTGALDRNAEHAEQNAKRRVAAQRLSKQAAEEALRVTEVATAHLIEKERPAIEGIIDQQSGLREAIKRVKDSSETYFDRVEAFHAEEKLRQAERIEDIRTVATAVLGLATEFGGVSAAAQNAAQQILNIGLNIGKALSGDITSIGGVLGSLTSVLGTIFGGESPEEKARREIVLRNTQAIQQNTERIGNLLGLGVGVGTIDAVQGIVEKVASDLGGITESKGPGANLRILQALSDAGLKPSDLEAVAKAAGIELQRDKQGFISAASLNALIESLRRLEPNQFGQDFGSQRRFISTAVSTGAIASESEFGSLVELAGRLGGKAITDVIGQFDVGTQAGREGALGGLRDLLLRLNTGEVPRSEFGRLSGDDFLSLLQDLIGILADPERRLNPVVIPLGDPNRPGVDTGEDRPGDRRPTFPPPPDEFGLALGDYLGESSPVADYLAQIVENTAAFKPVAPPPLAALLGASSASAPAAGRVDLSGATFQFTFGTAPASAAEARDYGQLAASALIEQLLANNLLNARLARGDAGRA